MTIDILGEIRKNPDYNAKNSWNWFQSHVRNAASSMKAMDMFHQTGVDVSSTFVPGQMMSFFYDPKGKDTLPYYDNFPLLLPFSKTTTHFTGLNLHYLPVRTRLVLLTKLLSTVNDDNMTKATRMKLSWSVLKNASKFPEVAPCVKQYLIGHVKSKFIVVHPKDWPSAIFLPTERFKGASMQEVWKSSTGYRIR